MFEEHKGILVSLLLFLKSVSTQQVLHVVKICKMNSCQEGLIIKLFGTTDDQRKVLCLLMLRSLLRVK